METKRLPSGEKIPVLGLGTWKLTGKTCAGAVKTALRLGYSHIDTAWVYGNQNEIGKALQEYGADRKKLFITSKVWQEHLHFADALNSIDETLSQLQTDYVDLLLVHWPNRSVPMEETFRAFKKIVDAGKAKSVGVSNFTERHLREAISVSEVPVSVNQVEFHPRLFQESLLGFCNENKIALTAYSPVGRGTLSNEPILKKIGKAHSASVAQVSLAWLMSKGIVVIPKASSETHLKENLEAVSLKLSKQELSGIDSLGSGHRLVNPGFAEFNE